VSNRCGSDAQLIGTNARAAMLRGGQYAGSGNQVDVGELGTHNCRTEYASSAVVVSG